MIMLQISFTKHTTMSPLASRLHLTSFFATPPEVLASSIPLSTDTSSLWDSTGMNFPPTVADDPLHVSSVFLLDQRASSASAIRAKK